MAEWLSDSGNLHTPVSMKGTSATKKARNTISAVLAVYVLTVALNLGEFWPFSIFPMFSQGGNPWSRALVREMPPEEFISWDAVGLDDLPGIPFGVASKGIDPIDLANFVSKTQRWDSIRVRALSIMLFASDAPDRRLLVFRVQAQLLDGGEVEIEATPYVLIAPGGALLNPIIQR